MSKASAILFFLLVILFGCQSNENKKDHNFDSPLIINGPTESIINESQADLINQLSLKDTLVMHLIMDSTHQHITIPIFVKGIKKMNGSLSSKDQNANVRFSQIQMPDGKLDGPFGSNLEYNARVDGKYLLIISQNSMAGDPWTGSFTLKVWGK